MFCAVYFLFLPVFFMHTAPFDTNLMTLFLICSLVT